MLMASDIVALILLTRLVIKDIKRYRRERLIVGNPPADRHEAYESLI